MEFSNFLTKLKATDSLPDLNTVFTEYNELLISKPSNSRAGLSLKVLCILCSHLNKVPSWSDGKLIDHKSLLLLTIECVRETRTMPDDDRAKVLSCIYHVMRNVHKMAISIPPELILKLFYMPYECDMEKLLKKHSAIYWNLISERLTYIEKLKTNKFSIIKLLPKLVEDILKVIQIFDTVQFCCKVLLFVTKKLLILYNGYSDELNSVYDRIFLCLSKKYDSKFLETLPEEILLEFYAKVNECLVVVAENSSKLNFKDSALSSIVMNCTTMFGHRPDMFHCFQTFYLNTFCCILSNKSNPSYIETILKGLVASCKMTEKMGYVKVMTATYPSLSQLFKLYIEYSVTNSKQRNWKEHFPIEIQENCLKFMLLLFQKMRNTEQILKCENCKFRTGLHDTLWLSFLIKHFISISLEQNLDITKILTLYHTVIENQYEILNVLRESKCANHDKLNRKLQTDIHNTAITLNKANHYECSLKLFDIYLQNEMTYTDKKDLKNICRALYNKSICELDCKLYENALKTAYLSLVFADVLTDKYMSLVIDIKGKALKASEDDDAQDNLQLVSVLDACVMALEEDSYGHLKQFLCHLRFGSLLRHEFEIYKKLWPSMVPIAGVWRALNGLSKGKYDKWICSKQEDISWMLYEIVLETPGTVRTIHCDYFVEIVTELLETFDCQRKQSLEEKLVHATLLFLKCEYDLAEASQKYGWKSQEQSMDVDSLRATRTFPLEHAAARRAARAAQLVMQTYTQPHTSPEQLKLSQLCLQTAQVFVYHYLHMNMLAEALALAHACCVMAQRVGDRECHVRNSSLLVYHSDAKSHAISSLMTQAGEHCSELMKREDTLETAIVFICDVAMYHYRIGSVHISAKFLQLAQAKILHGYDIYTNINLDLAVGKLMEAQHLICKEAASSYLSAVNTLQRHYLSVTSTGTSWSLARRRTLSTHHQRSNSAAHCVRLSRSLLQWRRARSAAAVSLARATAYYHGLLCADVTDPSNMDDAQAKIDNRLKHILGLQPSNETQPSYQEIESKTQPFTPKHDHVETMLENLVFKKAQTSPSVPCIAVQAYKRPEFFYHTKMCVCYACENPNCFVLAVKTSGLEASMYFRAKEYDIARNYFEGALDSFKNAEAKIQNLIKKYREMYEDFIVDIVERKICKEFGRVQVEILMEAAFFEMSQQKYDVADDYIIRIHEIVGNDGSFDRYLLNDVYNLMVASAQLRKDNKKAVDIGVESLTSDIDSLKIVTTPTKDVAEPPMTPLIKNKPPIATNKIVKDEELPKTKRKVIKLNLDEVASEEKEPKKRVAKKNVFKIPVPVTSKPALESITPRQTRSKPEILVTQSSFDTPKPKNVTEFFTPHENTPNEQFFTPMTSLKTYTKKSLRQNIVKNLESEFSTPKGDKENSTLPPSESLLQVPKSRAKETLKGPKDRRLKRATSPGKLCTQKTNIPTRRRLRQAVNFSVDEDDRK